MAGRLAPIQTFNVLSKWLECSYNRDKFMRSVQYTFALLSALEVKTVANFGSAAAQLFQIRRVCRVGAFLGKWKVFEKDVLQGAFASPEELGRAVRNAFSLLFLSVDTMAFFSSLTSAAERTRKLNLLCAKIWLVYLCICLSDNALKYVFKSKHDHQNSRSHIEDTLNLPLAVWRVQTLQAGEEPAPTVSMGMLGLVSSLLAVRRLK
mmetsp:Transcript_48399/g.121846  ORF Transcript_48399/g.121846 Transcript_48399/m.121846 type:complete len:207 (+) Transcript_48399:110-730(+)